MAGGATPELNGHSLEHDALFAVEAMHVLHRPPGMCICFCSNSSPESNTRTNDEAGEPFHDQIVNERAPDEVCPPETPWPTWVVCAAVYSSVV
jgi:hypothetical protein